MGANGTIEHRKTVFNTIGSGLKSLATLSKPKYVLEHLTTDSQFTKGEKHSILVDYVEIGRNNKAYLQYGEDQQTVSRSHAAIAKEGKDYVLQQLSTVNQTLLNGKPVNRQWFLQNGDIIQLSTAGPKLRFIVPSEIGPISPTWDQTRELFKQMIKPYRNGMIGLASVVFIAICSFTGWEYFQEKRLDQRLTALVEMDNTIIQVIDSVTIRQDSINLKMFNNIEELNNTIEEKIDKVNSDITRLKTSTRASIRRLRNDINVKFEESATAMRQEMRENISSLPIGDKLYEGHEALKPDIYFITTEVGVINRATGEKKIISETMGTGFMLSDGKFVTARHCVEPWVFIDPRAVGSMSPMHIANLLINNSAGRARAKVYSKISAYSPSGNTFVLTNEQFRVNRSRDQINNTQIQGERISLKTIGSWTTDFAVANTSQSGSLDAAYTYSRDIPVGKRLIVAGYPSGWGAREVRNITDYQPYYSHEEKSHPGLRDGMIEIPITTRQGNSGGPVFVKNQGKFQVIGILVLGKGDVAGGIRYNGIVPINNIR